MIKILVDSASDCRNNVSLYCGCVPINVSIGGKNYADGVGLESDRFYELLMETKEFPKTSQPSPQDFMSHFEQAKTDGEELIYFALSSALSGTYQSALIAKDMVEYDGIYIIDSKTATHGINLLAGYGAKLAERGMAAEEIVRKCETLKHRIKIVAGVDTLEYLQRGGRLSKTSAAVGELARIKPIITVTLEGKVANAGKGMGRASAMQLIVKQLAGCEPDEQFPVYSLYTYGEENCEQLEKALEAKGYSVADRLQVGASIGAHVGPGVYGILFVTKS